MKTTDYVGIDYGLGKSNVDNETGLRYGVISQHTPNPDATNDIWSNGRDLGFEAYQDEIKANLRSALSDVFSERGGVKGESPLDIAVNDAFDAIEQDVNDRYMGDSGPMLYEESGYKLQTTESEIWVLKSPFFTHAQYCSPCAPGAGNLDTYCPDGPKTYCLGHDWFDDNKAPYPVYSVETGELVNP